MLSYPVYLRAVSLLTSKIASTRSGAQQNLYRQQLIALTYGASLRRVHVMAVKAKGKA